MTVTDIAIRRRGLSAVTLSPPPEKIADGEYEGERLLIDREILARCQIEKGSELGEEDVKNLCYVSACFRAKQKAIWHLSQSDHSEKALFEKLCRSFPEKAAAFAVAMMRERGYVDDRKYARYLAKKFRTENRSKRETLEKMYLKGIPTDLAKEVLSDAGFEDDECQRAVALIKSRYLSKINDEDGVKKVIAALQRKGFSFADIKKALEIILQEIE